MQPDSNSSNKYDLSKLPHGEIFKVGFTNGIAVKVWPFFIVGFVFLFRILITVTHSDQTAENLSQKAAPIWAFLVIGIVLLSILFAFGDHIRRWLYKRAVRSFGSLNNLEPLEESQMTGCIPPSIQDKDAYNIYRYGYTFPIVKEGVRIFDYTFTVGSGKSSQDYQYAIAAIPLTKQYPHIFLDGKANGRNYTYAGKQKVELEGDFSKYFELYVPNGAQDDALTILTPDVMETIEKFAKPYDIEIEDNVCAIMASGFAFTKEDLTNFLAISAALSKEFAQLNMSWKPDYAPGGQPFVLKKRFSQVIIIFLATIILLSILELAQYFVANAK